MTPPLLTIWHYVLLKQQPCTQTREIHTYVFLLNIQIILRFGRHILMLKLGWQAQNQLVETWSHNPSKTSDKALGPLDYWKLSNHELLKPISAWPPLKRLKLMRSPSWKRGIPTSGCSVHLPLASPAARHIPYTHNMSSNTFVIFCPHLLPFLSNPS